tara:strand:- start:615 stop:1004 length:390 start_codon:yes stop_codon:yes gene_type:complete
LNPASFSAVLLLRTPKNFSRKKFCEKNFREYDSAMSKKDPRLARAGVSGYNKPKRTPSHPKKSHIVVAKEGDKIKTIRFGQQGVKTAGKPKKGESAKQKARRKSFKARHSKNIKKGKMSAAYWADKVKW